MSSSGKGGDHDDEGRHGRPSQGHDQDEHRSAHPAQGHKNEHAQHAQGHKNEHAQGHKNEHAQGHKNEHAQGHRNEHGQGHKNEHAQGHKNEHAQGHRNEHGQHAQGHRNEHGQHAQGHRNEHAQGHKNEHGQHAQGHKNEHAQHAQGHRNEHGQHAPGHSPEQHDRGEQPQGQSADSAEKKRGKRWEPSDDQNEELEFELPSATKVSRGKGLLFVGIGVGIVALLILLGFIPKWRERSAVRKDADQETKAAPRVELVTPKVMQQTRPLELPGIIQALEDTVVYPRATGYVRRWLVDIGDQVKEGQLLAEIETPDLDAQIDQARADLAQADATEVRAETSAALSTTEQKRYETLTPAGVTTGQELETRRTQARVDDANIRVAKATVASQQANLNRLTRLKSFARPIAPFSGTITARTIERGQLVTPSTTSPMFRIAALDPVRIFVQVPQDVAPSIRTGTRSDIAIREFPSKVFEGTVSRAAGALDDSTRTMTTEIRVPNARHELLPGMYVKAVLSLSVPHRVFEVPSTALYIDAQGVRVAVVDSENEVTMRKVSIERDTGNSIQISQGLDGSEHLVKIANSALVDGVKVELIETKAKPDDRTATTPPEKTTAAQAQPKAAKPDGDKADSKVRTKSESDEGAEKSPLPGGAPKHEAEPSLREMKPVAPTTRSPQTGTDPRAPE